MSCKFVVNIKYNEMDSVLTFYLRYINKLLDYFLRGITFYWFYFLFALFVLKFSYQSFLLTMLC